MMVILLSPMFFLLMISSPLPYLVGHLSGLDHAAERTLLVRRRCLFPGILYFLRRQTNDVLDSRADSRDRAGLFSRMGLCND
jgi:hypothetical protein